MRQVLMIACALGAFTAASVAVPALAEVTQDENVCSGLTNDSADVRIQACTRAIDAGNPSDLSVVYHNRAGLYGRSGNLNKAIEDMTAAIKADPNDADNFVGRSSYWIDAKKYQSAIEDCDSAIKIVESGNSTYSEDNEVMAGAYANRALAHLRLKQRNDAIADFRKALSFPADDETLANVRKMMSENGLTP